MLGYGDDMGRLRSTAPGDLVLVHFREQPATFARVEAIRPHERPGWFCCDLLVLAVPTQPVTWILERQQIDGDPFTMGQGVRIERLPDVGSAHGHSVPEEEKGAPRSEAPFQAPRNKPSKVVSLFPRSGPRPIELMGLGAQRARAETHGLVGRVPLSTALHRAGLL